MRPIILILITRFSIWSVTAAVSCSATSCGPMQELSALEYSRQAGAEIGSQ